jgi:hypothetical protein
MKNVPYAQVMGILMYVVTSIRHDICHVVGLISMFQIQSNKSTLSSSEANTVIFAWHQGMKLCIGLSDFDFIACSDAGFVGYVDNKNFTSQCVFLFGGIIVSWFE